MTDTAHLTARKIIHLSPEELISLPDIGAAYRELRSWMEEQYALYVGPRRESKRRKDVDRLRAAARGSWEPMYGDRHTRRADRWEQDINDDLTEYQRAAVQKSALAVLRGAADAHLREGRRGYHTVNGQIPLAVAAAEEVRLQQLKDS